MEDNSKMLCICGYNFSSPCLNGGTCADNVAAFSCTCDSGWTGSMCHEMDDPCAG